jgi:excisionase family DNA binding protein
VAQLEHQVAVLSRKLGLITRPDVEMTAELLRASEAARRLGVPTKEVLRLVRDRQIRYVMVDGIAYVPDDALEEYRAKVS